ncbi:MAG: dynamin family protein [Oscillospiraceae bacterium]|nr:dynamin family protein [Oscillospiraceae bacterium]
MKNKISGFGDYRKLVIDVCSYLGKLKEFCDELGLDNSGQVISEVLERVSNQAFSIAIVGEFKRGKSTLINALLGQDVLPTDILPCSATLNRITYGIAPSVEVRFKDGNIDRVDINRLTDYVTKLTPEAEQLSANVSEATVYYPVNYCMNNVDIIDTPGLNDDKNMTDVTLSVLPRSDAAIMTIMATSPFSDYERDFLENKLLTSDMGRVLFVVTRIDSFDDEDDVQKVLASITGRIEKYTMDKAAKTYGADSPEYAVFKRKIGKPKVYGISAKQAVKGKLTGNNDLLERSRFPDFEKALENFLTEERGSVLLQVPLNRAVSGAAEILKTIELRENALSMKKEEFEAKHAEALAELENVRVKKRAELNRLTDSAEASFQNMQPLLDNFWGEVSDTAEAVVYNSPITDDDIKKDRAEATQQRLAEEISRAVSIKAQEFTERVQVEIERNVAADVGKSGAFAQYLSESLGNIHHMFAGGGNVIQTKDMAIGGALSWLGGFGIGGAYMGFKQGGWKGALAGGAAGVAGAVGASVGIAAIAGAVGLTIAGPALLVAGAITAVASVFSSKFVLKKFFNNNAVPKFRESFAEAVRSQIGEFRKNGDFIEQIRSQVFGAYGQIKENVERDTETVLRDTEQTLSSIKEQLTADKVASEHEKERLLAMAAECRAIIDEAQRLNNMLIPEENEEETL